MLTDEEIDEGAGPAKVAIAKYALDLIGTLPTTPCELGYIPS